MSDFKYEIIRNIGVVSENARGWKKELNLISWNDRDPKYDLREWGPDHEKMGKGITLTEEELQNLSSLLQEMDFPENLESWNKEAHFSGRSKGRAEVRFFMQWLNSLMYEEKTSIIWAW